MVVVVVALVLFLTVSVCSARLALRVLRAGLAQPPEQALPTATLESPSSADAARVRAPRAARRIGNALAIVVGLLLLAGPFIVAYEMCHGLGALALKH